MEGILTMNSKEVYRIKIMSQAEDKKLSIEEAAEQMEVSQRQAYRIKKLFEEEGPKAIIHKLRGKKSNRGYPEKLKSEVIKLYRSQYSDYGPTLFTEMLTKHHNISISDETARKWLRENAITTSMRKKRPHRKKRQRRSCFGELLQFDGSIHDWFEGRGAECCLLCCVDDATGRVFLRFSVSENTQDCMITLWEYIKKYGIPKSIYTDKGSVYYSEGVLTDFGRAMNELGIEMIFAKSPQAKGRVERFNRTLQDRLVKALRRKAISNIAEANKYLQKEFMKEFNRKFSLSLEDIADVHRPAKGYKLQEIFCFKTYRQVRNDYTINLNGGYIQLLKGKAPLPKPMQDVTVCKFFNDKMEIYFNDQQLNYQILKSKPKKVRIYYSQKEHPWRKRNQKLPGHRKFIGAAFG